MALNSRARRSRGEDSVARSKPYPERRGTVSRRKMSDRAMSATRLVLLSLSGGMGPSARSQCLASWEEGAREVSGVVSRMLRVLLRPGACVPLVTGGSVYPLIVGLESPRIYFTSSHSSLGEPMGMAGEAACSSVAIAGPALEGLFANPTVVVAMILSFC